MKTKACKKCGCVVHQIAEKEFSTDLAINPALSHETLASLWANNQCPRCLGVEHLIAGQ